MQQIWKQGAVFDLDGTLLDSMYVWPEVDQRFFAKRGLEVPEGYVKEISPMGFDKAADYTISRFHLKEAPEAVKREWMDMVREAYHNSVQLKPCVKEYLRWLYEQGIRIAAATSSHLELMAPCLERNGVYSLFSNITVTDEVPRGKGFPDVYQKAAKKLGLNACECVVYEDLLAGIQGAKAGGFITVGVYDESAASDAVAIRNEADYYIRHFGELLSLTNEDGLHTLIRNKTGGVRL